MSEPRKNHLTIDGGQGREDEHVVASYKPIPESDTGFRTSKSNLSKSKEKVSAEEEKLLEKEDEAKITTRVDMADAKYVVGDHRNGDAKIELDANKRQFSGLTKEELMKYADDPFWVRLRWFMFIMFWALWLCMLAGAIAIIVRAPKCAPPPPKTWYEKGPLVDMSSVDNFENLESELPLLQNSQVEGIFTYVCKDTYEVLETPDCLQQFKDFVTKAKKYSIKVIVDLTANFVSKSHTWFALSENRSAEYDNYFIWAKGGDYDEAGKPQVPNNWVSTLDTPAWSWSEQRQEFYLHQYGEDQPDLNFTNPDVVRQFDKVLKLWMEAGADGIRLHKARQLVVNASLADEVADAGSGIAREATHSQYKFWRHRHTSDLPALEPLLAHWAHLVDHTPPATGAGETVFTLAEERRPELFLLRHNLTSLRPPSAAPIQVSNAAEVVVRLRNLLPYWPAIQLVDEEETNEELSSLALLLPAAPVVDINQLGVDNNTTDSSHFSQMAAMRQDSSIEHGLYSIAAVPAQNSTNKLIACARWKSGHTGYAAVYNPNLEEARANLTSLSTVPSSLTIHHVSLNVKLYTNYTNNAAVNSDDVLVPPKSTVVLSYVPNTTVEN
ncbi:unnamed protein product [Parnassius mnemosyne]|uniref:alpha-glucosidase n=1 Tax=Parnassius mnemosyne TaxID=213953 RepID=A0AAV1KN92_9NEOP